MKTFSEIYTSAMNQVKLPLTDTDALTACKDSINQRYHSLAYRKKWPWRISQFDITVPAKATTGTVEVVEGDRTVDFIGAGLTAEHEGWFLKITGFEEIYKVIGLNVATQEATLSAIYAGTTNAAATYVLFKFQHGLPPDAEELDAVWHEHNRYPVDIITPRDFLDRQVMNPWQEGKAEVVASTGFKAYEGPTLGNFILGYDFLNSSDDDDMMIMTYPIVPDARYTLHLRYVKRVSDLVNDSDEPLLPADKRQILWYGALSDMFMRDRNNETATYYDRKFETEVARMEADSIQTDDKPRLKVDMRKYYRQHFYRRINRSNRFDYD